MEMVFSFPDTRTRVYPRSALSQNGLGKALFLQQSASMHRERGSVSRSVNGVRDCEATGVDSCWHVDMPEWHDLSMADRKHGTLAYLWLPPHGHMTAM